MLHRHGHHVRLPIGQEVRGLAEPVVDAVALDAALRELHHVLAEVAGASQRRCETFFDELNEFGVHSVGTSSR
ncbi:MAG: hypothetical protein DI536_15555 [Archangium gephyra]|uniref:Uncharacterized protein n=1 Tax=Archangium gephyra TaxID=48 RepID=A0A2W5TEF3_9BACT|nr:MAG: hypothetical protein DI536_15555 [Archangium gephyra]